MYTTNNRLLCSPAASEQQLAAAPGSSSSSSKNLKKKMKKNIATFRQRYGEKVKYMAGAALPVLAVLGAVGLGIGCCKMRSRLLGNNRKKQYKQLRYAYI